jgi:hypothetical protein
MVLHGAILPDSIRRQLQQERQPAKLAGRMKHRWRVVLLRHKGEILGQVEAPDAEAAKAAAGRC